MTITRIWQSGAELNSTGEFDATYTGASATVTIAAGALFTGSYGLSLNGTAQSGTNTSVSKNVPNTYQGRGGFMLRANEASDEVRIFSIGTTGGTILADIRIPATDDNFIVTIAGATVGTIPYTPLRWYHIGYDFKFDGSSGWLNIYIDGVLKVEYSGNTGTTQCSRLYFGSQPKLNSYGLANAWYFDDMYFDDTTGESSATAPPIYHFVLSSPNDNGNYSDWTGSDGNQVDNYALVDEKPPSSTDYVQALSGSLKDSYAMSSPTLPLNAVITAVIPTAIARKDSGDVTIKLGTRLGGVDESGSELSLGVAYTYFYSRFPTKPGGGSWTTSDIDDFETLIISSGAW